MGVLESLETVIAAYKIETTRLLLPKSDASLLLGCNSVKNHPDWPRVPQYSKRRYEEFILSKSILESGICPGFNIDSLDVRFAENLIYNLSIGTYSSSSAFTNYPITKYTKTITIVKEGKIECQ